MFNELIYTRCGTGRDITKKGSIIANEGYKFHSCSESLFTDGSVFDFQFLKNIAGVSHPFSEPDFVDDAYLYYVPEKGKPIFQNFHPIQNSKGRAGNFISQIFIGDPCAYPCEAFGSKDWDAKLKDENYYYGFQGNAPAWLLQRKAPLSQGEVSFESAGRFISQGRSELLKAAVWFLYSQYALPPEERKYLIIKDTTKNIELWIAAIEYAFPSSIARTIPFATRMADAAATGGTKGNRYFVGPDGLSVPLSEEKPEKRLKAMIVGIDLKEQAINMLRLLPAYPYCLLDGIQKTVSFSTDAGIKEYYYDLITKFDVCHKNFNLFLSDIPDLRISGDIIKLCDAFKYLYLVQDESWTGAELVKYLELLMEYKNVGASETPVQKVVSRINSILHKDETNGYRLFDILRKINAVTEHEIYIAALNIFSYKLSVGSPDLKQSFDNIKRQSFARDAVSKLISDESVGQYEKLITGSDMAQADRFFEFYGEALKFVNQKMCASGIRLISIFLEKCLRINDHENTTKTIRNFIHSNENADDIIFPLVEKYKSDIGKSELLWNCIIEGFVGNLFGEDFKEFCDLTRNHGFADKIENLLCIKLRKGEAIDALYKIFRYTYKAPISYPRGENFFKEIVERTNNISLFSETIDFINEAGLDEKILILLYDILDKKLPVIVKPDSMEDRIERMLLAHRPKNTNCSHSRCGIILSNIIKYSQQVDKIKDIIRTNIEAGPIVVGKDFAKSDFCARLLDKTLPKIDGSTWHVMLLLIFTMPEPAMDKYVFNYLDKAFSLLNKKNDIFLYFLDILNYKPGAPSRISNDVIIICGSERFTSLQDKIMTFIPLAYANVFSEKLDNNLRGAIAERKDANLLKLFERISNAAKMEYTKNYGGTIMGALKKLFGSFK